MAKPKYSNDRIKHQSAVFMVFPNTVCDYRSRMVILGRRNGNEEDYRQGFTLTDEEYKRLEYVRKEPKLYDDSFAVSSNTMRKMFDYYGNQFEDFYNNQDFGINQKYHFLFTDRFSLLYSIQKLSDEMISKSFISILVEEKSKKKILKDLASLGIDKAFVFPELEYTAEMVKNKYF